MNRRNFGEVYKVVAHLSVPISPMWHTCLIRHSNSSTAGAEEAVPMNMGNKLIVAWASLVSDHMGVVAQLGPGNN